MVGDLPEYYFRIRDTGAVVFRVDTQNRQRRIEMDEIATINIKNGNIRPHGEHRLTEAERVLIEDWISARKQTLARRETDDIHRTIDQINQTAQWVQSRASDAQLDEVTDALLLAIFDLRSTIVRKQADRLIRDTQIKDGPQSADDESPDSES